MSVHTSPCLFCELKNHNTKIEFENEHVFVINDLNPHAPLHQLIIPKLHIATLNDITPENQWIIGELILVAQRQAATHNIHKEGFRTVFNCNAPAGQTIFHLHLHLLGGRKLQWPPG